MSFPRLTLKSLLVLSLFCALHAGTPAFRKAADRTWDIRIDTASIERILLDPETILEDPDAFWRSDPAYRLADNWHRNTGILKSTNDYDKRWLSFLREQAAVPRGERKNHPAFKFLDILKGKKEAFYATALPHIRRFLPDNGLAFRSCVFLTAKTFPYAFMTSGNMVIDVLNPKLHQDADQIFNILTHETFHIGYGYNRYLRSEPALEDDFIYNTLLDSLQNEGMAVYMAFQAQSFFPAKNESDYRLLEDPGEVGKRIEGINRIFDLADRKTLSEVALRKQAWELGVNQRGYYIAGAKMARIIDEKLGRDALVRTVSDGPLSFIDRYNEVAEQGLAVHRFNRPAVLAPLSRLLQETKMAVLARDEARFDSLVRKLGQSTDLSDPKIQLRLASFGYGQLYIQHWDWAIKVFTAGVGLFPNSADAWDGLAEARLKAGDLDLAELYCHKAVQLDPRLENPKTILDEIKRLRTEKKVKRRGSAP
jgi:tetratricopeptide (TPR) repeat protein